MSDYADDEPEGIVARVKVPYAISPLATLN